jgi:hypothetical protein
MPAAETGMIVDDEPVAKPVRLDAVFDDFTNEDYSEED